MLYPVNLTYMYVTPRRGRYTENEHNLGRAICNIRDVYQDIFWRVEIGGFKESLFSSEAKELVVYIESEPALLKYFNRQQNIIKYLRKIKEQENDR